MAASAFDAARRLVPGRWRPAIRWWLEGLRAASWRGNARYCPCCGGSFRVFLPHGVGQRPDAKCPRCGSLERHRLIWLYLERNPELLAGKRRLLHVAPEYLFYRRFRAMPGLDYIPADLQHPLAKVKLDLCKMPFEDNSIDGVICNHVLEHVPDDRLAMREILRVLKPGGWAILQTPFEQHREVTFEDPSVENPAERLRLFGQDDHVRVYGRDFYDRLRQAGFDVQPVNLAVQLTDAERDRLRLMPDEDLVWCRKPAAA